MKPEKNNQNENVQDENRMDGNKPEKKANSEPERIRCERCNTLFLPLAEGQRLCRECRDKQDWDKQVLEYQLLGIL